jgi:16S rRNA (guanine527-N7)-methyltransferase
VSSIGCAPSLSAEIRTSGDTGNRIGDAAWSGLEPAAETLGLALGPHAIARFARYRDLLVERASQFNLTAIRDPAEIERRLFFDAMAMVPALDAVLHQQHAVDGAPVTLVDVGSGAGFPGLALKIARPAMRVTLIDATAKKVAFLTEVIAALDLADARAVHGRAEELGHDRAYRAGFDIATARAVAALPVLLEYVVPLLRLGGTALLPKGAEITDELAEGRRAATDLGAEIVAADVLPATGTRLVVVNKVAPTPRIYPRRAGMALRKPLGRRS